VVTIELKRIRLEKKFSVQKLSELTGIHRRTIEDIESRGDCMVSNAIKLAISLNVDLNELCGFNMDKTEV